MTHNPVKNRFNVLFDETLSRERAVFCEVGLGDQKIHSCDVEDAKEHYVSVKVKNKLTPASDPVYVYMNLFFWN